VNKTDTVSE